MFLHLLLGSAFGLIWFENPIMDFPGSKTDQNHDTRQNHGAKAVWLNLTRLLAGKAFLFQKSVKPQRFDSARLVPYPSRSSSAKTANNSKCTHLSTVMITTNHVDRVELKPTKKHNILHSKFNK